MKTLLAFSALFLVSTASHASITVYGRSTLEIIAIMQSREVARAMNPNVPIRQVTRMEDGDGYWVGGTDGCSLPVHVEPVNVPGSVVPKFELTLGSMMCT